MSPSERLDVVRQLYEAVERRDVSAVLALYDAHVEWQDHGTPLGDIRGGRVFHGHDGLREWFQEWNSAWEHWTDDIDQIFEVGEHVISVVNGHGRGRASGIDAHYRRVGLWTIRYGKVIRVRWFQTVPEAVAAAHAAS